MHAKWKFAAGALGALSLTFAAAAGTAGTAFAAKSPAIVKVSSKPLALLKRVGNIQQASNWSGYVETGGTYTAVTGKWKVPVNKNTGSGERISSQWIGIDGDGNQDLIQTGTQVQDIGGQVSYGAWWEILPASETPINEPVKPGETITASITKESGNKWVIKISDGSWTFTTTKSYSGPGKSIEWIVEAPEVGGSIVTMGHTARVTFTGLTSNGANPKLVAADEIECVQNKKVVEIPSAPSAAGNSFAIQYGAKAPAPPK